MPSSSMPFLRMASHSASVWHSLTGRREPETSRVAQTLSLGLLGVVGAAETNSTCLVLGPVQATARQENPNNSERTVRRICKPLDTRTDGIEPPHAAIRFGDDLATRLGSCLLRPSLSAKGAAHEAHFAALD